MSITAHAVPILSDNYAWLLRDDASGATAIVDPADPAPIIAAIERHAGGKLDLILLTHHHADHVAGTDAVRARFGAPVVGAAADARRLPKLDVAVKPGDSVALGSALATCDRHAGPHDRATSPITSPTAGCCCAATRCSAWAAGALLEGTPADMFASLAKLAKLPGETLVCCGHEYTQSNARFAVTVEPDNAALAARSAEVNRLRRGGPRHRAIHARRRVGGETRSCVPPTWPASPKSAPAKTSSEGTVPVKLYYSPTSPYVRKVMACAISREIDARIERIPTNPHVSPARPDRRQSAVQGALPGDR